MKKFCRVICIQEIVHSKFQFSTILYGFSDKWIYVYAYLFESICIYLYMYVYICIIVLFYFLHPYSLSLCFFFFFFAMGPWSESAKSQPIGLPGNTPTTHTHSHTLSHTHTLTHSLFFKGHAHSCLLISPKVSLSFLFL